MSTESETLERETLEKKSRDELHTIVNTLGLKVGSRARKSELVDAILDHALPSVNDGAATDGDRRDASRDGSPSDSGDAESSRSVTTGSVALPSDREAGSPNGSGGDAGSVVRRTRRAAGYSASPSDDAERADAQRSARPASSTGTTFGGGTTADRYDGAATGAQAGVAVATPQADRLGQADAGNGTTEAADTTPAAEERIDAERSDERHTESSRPDDSALESGGADSALQDDQQRQGDTAEPADTDDADDPNRGDNRQGRGDTMGEPGNRRRRRRGRDRERERDRERPDEGPVAEPVEVEGILDLRDEGYGFLRTRGFLPSKDDVYVSAKQVRQMGLRKGDTITGLGRPAARSEKNPAMLRIDLVNGEAPEEARKRPKFEDLTPLFPDQKLRVELLDDPTNMTNRIIDLISPIGKGQRGLIVSPPKAGKTMIIKSIAQAIERNNPEVQLIVLLVDERPEEVTDMRRSIQGEVVASTFDRPSDEHTQVAELTIERAKRLVEEGTDVVIILDGITRLARAYNLAAPATGRIMSGGVDSGALYPPKRFFGAARNIEEGGSLTILATALIDTGSKMDEVIFEEFKGTGNMELRLDRRLAERRIYPAIDVDASSTRHEELLFERKQLQQVWKLRRVLSGLSGGDGDGRPGAGLELLLDRLKTFRSNDDFLAEIAKAPSM